MRRSKKASCPAAAWPCCVAREAVEAARSSAKGDEKIGVDIVLGVLDAPLKQIADNCGLEGSVVADEVSQKATNIGYDANAGEYVDMIKAGIIDPDQGREDGPGQRGQHRRPDAHDRGPGHELRLEGRGQESGGRQHPLDAL